MAETVTYKVLFFAWVRETAGKDEEDITLPEGATGEDLRTYLIDTYPALAARSDKLNLAINQMHAEWSTVLTPKDELAVFPPVTGG